MNKILFLLFLIISCNAEAQQKNGFCNFLLELGEGVEMDSTYKMTGVGFENIKLRHQEKIMKELNFAELINTTVNMSYLQSGLASVCQYKKWEIIKVRIVKRGEGVLLELHYEVIPKSTKSKV